MIVRSGPPTGLVVGAGNGVYGDAYEWAPD